jgi:putative transposase
MKKRFSDEQIISILREAEAGVSARELCRKHAISDATFYTWRKKFGGMEVPEVKRLKSLEEENADVRVGFAVCLGRSPTLSCSA